MSRTRRTVLSVSGLAALICVTGYFDPVLAIDVGYFSILAAIFITQVVRWWGEPKPLWRRIIGTGLGMILLLPLILLAYLPVPAICTLFVGNFSNHKAVEQLREIVIALHNYHHDHQQFPAAATRSAPGQPLLSWRVQLLPYLGHKELYQRFRLEEPWNSPHNLTLLPQMPDCYRLPFYGHQAERGGTFFQLIVGPGAAFELGKQATIPELQANGRLDSTIIMGIAQEAVPWTKPGDLGFEEGRPLALGRVVRRNPIMLGVIFPGEPGEGNRAYRLIFADGHCGSVYSKETIGQLGPFVQWRGPNPGYLENLR